MTFQGEEGKEDWRTDKTMLHPRFQNKYHHGEVKGGAMKFGQSVSICRRRGPSWS